MNYSRILPASTGPVFFAWLLFLAAGFWQCQPGDEPAITILDEQMYKSEIAAWHKHRMSALKASDGWLNLAGLYWLEEGENSFGAGADNDLVFPEGKIGSKAGTLILKDSTVTMVPEKEVAISADSVLVKGAIQVYHPDSAHGKVLQHGSLRWNIIRRQDKFGLRLRDLDHEVLKIFEGINRFPLDQQWRVQAEFLPSTPGSTVNITNVLGQTVPNASPGSLRFMLHGEPCELVLLDEGTDEFFIIFGDKTNGKETYKGGRFLYPKKPAKGSNVVWLDFNKALNPPCVFTPYATCPLPPKSNHLNFSVTAGEMLYKAKDQ